MKHKNKKIKKLLACILCAAMASSTLLSLYCGTASATRAADTSNPQSYGAWQDIVPVNGSFEVGYEGMDVYGWSLTAMTNACAKVTNDYTKSEYLKSYELKTATEPDGNKVAALYKDGAGYVGVTSLPIAVEPNSSYRISFDYKVPEVSVKIDPATGKEYENNNRYFGIRSVIEQFHGDTSLDSELKRDFSDGGKYFDEWSTSISEFTTYENTDTVVIYLWFGAESRVAATVLFDNVKVEKNDDYAVVNGDFEQITHFADGGRAEGTAGPAGWTMVGAASGVKLQNANSANKNYFQATIVADEERGNVVKLEHNSTSKTNAYAMLQSQLIPVNGANRVVVTADYKIMCWDADGNELNVGVGNSIGFHIECYDSKRVRLESELGSTLVATTNLKWQKEYRAWTTPTDTAYVKVGLFIPYLSSSPASYAVYFDNVSINVQHKALGYTKVVTKNEGGANSQNDSVLATYSVRRVNGGSGYEDAVQLYVTRDDGAEGTVTFYSDPIDIEAKTEYRTSFDLKIEGVPEQTKSNGADYVLRYKDSEGRYLPEVTALLKDNNVKTQDWKEYQYTFMTPEDAAQVEIGLCIGVSSKQHAEQITHTWANIELRQVSDAYWTSDECIKAKETDLLFVMLKGGEANNDASGAIDVKDIARMKKNIADKTVEIADTADMNKNGKIDKDDVQLLRWKILGLDTKEKIQSRIIM